MARVLLWMLLCGSSAHASEPLILVLGDSLSAAYGMEAAQGWPRLLELRLEQSGYPYRVVNASISGDTTRSGLERLPAALDRYRPAVVILELGANDGLRGLAPAEIEHNLAAMIDLARSRGARVLLAGMRLPPNYGPSYIDRFKEVYFSLARQAGVPLIPFLLEGVGGNPALTEEDGLHPKAEGQPRILDNVWAYLRPMLETH
jgi:acyl-CoA thioesterase-1